MFLLSTRALSLSKSSKRLFIIQVQLMFYTLVRQFTISKRDFLGYIVVSIFYIFFYSIPQIYSITVVCPFMIYLFLIFFKSISSYYIFICFGTFLAQKTMIFSQLATLVAYFVYNTLALIVFFSLPHQTLMRIMGNLLLSFAIYAIEVQMAFSIYSNSYASPPFCV